MDHVLYFMNRGQITTRSTSNGGSPPSEVIRRFRAVPSSVTFDCISSKSD